MSVNDNNRNDSNTPPVPVVLSRTETTSLATRRSFEPLAFRPPKHSLSGTLGAVYQAKCARVIEKETAIILGEIAKQSGSIRTITENLSAAHRVHAETAVFIEQQHAEWLHAHRNVALALDQIAVDRYLQPQQLTLQEKQIQRALIDVEAEIDAAHIRRESVPELEAHRNRLQRDLDTRRMERMNEREEADHQLYLADSDAKRRTFAPPPPALPPPPPAPTFTFPVLPALPPPDAPQHGDQQEARNVAEDVADGHILTDARHLYHAFAAVAWLGCIRRGVPRDEALQFVAHKVLDRMQRHPLDERDARVYHQRYLEDLETFRQEQAESQAARAKREAADARERAKQRDLDVRLTEARIQKETVLGKAQMERDAALARERTVSIFKPDDDFSAEDDGDVH
jgi:hypothetical protein